MLAVVVALLALVAGNAGAAVSPVPRFSADDTGGIAIAGNTLMTCPTSDVNCARSQAGTATGAALNNNGFAMGYVDVDGDPTTFDSSSATVTLPAGATVLFAGLYYGGRTTAGTGGLPALNAAARGAVALRSPGAAGYTPLAATVYDSGAIAGVYAGFADVTGQVQAAGAGSYTVANVQSGTGLDRYAGWSLVIAYHDANSPPRSLTVFDGLATIQQGDQPLSLPVSGFVTPPTGTVHSTVGIVAYEGDRGSAGDRLSLNGQGLTDAANPVNNVFNSSIATAGVDVGGRTPNYVNQLGFDADTIAADGVLPNGATSATLHESTTLDQYFTQVVTLATDLLAPRLTASKGVENVTHPAGPNEPGDVLRYTVDVGNSGQDAAAGVSVADSAPAGTSYVPGSLVAGGAGQTDATGDDAGSAAGGAVAFTLGSLAPGATVTVSFEVRIDAGLATGTTISNVATATGRGTAAPIPLSAVTPAVDTVVTAVPVPPVPPVPVVVPPVPPVVAPPAFKVTATVTPAQPQTGQPAVEAVMLRNETDAAVRDVRATVTLPEADVLSVSPSQGSCARHDAHSVRCALGTVAPGKRVVLRVRVKPGSGSGSLATRVKVTGKGIRTQTTVTLRHTHVRAAAPVRRRAGVAVGISVSAERARPGAVVSFRVTVRSTGGVAARGARVCDAVPNGLVVTSAAGGRRSSGRRVCWTVGSLAAGRSKAFTLTARVHRAQPGRLVSVASARAANAPAARAVRAAVFVVPLAPTACGSAVVAHAAC